jgi:membrane-bound ClpP family serine protease
MADQILPATAFKSPAIALSGVVDYEMYTKFGQQFDQAADKSLVVIELSTLGGDPEVARMMGEDVRFASETDPTRRFVFLGKAAIYSAGVTFMSFFARPNRY